MTRFAILLGLLLILLEHPALAKAPDWKPLAIADDHSSWLFLDPSSIVRRQKNTSVRVLLEYADLVPGIPETADRPYIMVRSLMSFNCTNKTLLLLEEEYLDADNTLLGEADVSDATWDPVLPESLIEPVYDTVCSKK